MTTRLRQLRRLEYFDPESALRAASAFERIVAESDTPDLVRRLRTGRLKSTREARDALIFAHGMSHVCRTKCWVAPGEIEDFDFVTRIAVADTTVFSGVQLKEWPPEDLSPEMDFSRLVAKLESLPPSDAVLAVHLNRRGVVPISALNAIRVRHAELWFFWATNATYSDWILHGNVLAEPISHSFAYPR